MIMPEEALPVQKLREYLRIKTVHPTPDYGKDSDIIECYSATAIGTSIISFFLPQQCKKLFLK